MQFKKLTPYKSWLVSAAITSAIALWLMSGTIESDAGSHDVVQVENQHSEIRPNVRVRRQVAEEVTRTIAVNGRTAPARIVAINAETDGRVVAVGRQRGDRLDHGDVIVQLDERDRRARLAQATATVKQRELEFSAREKLLGDSYVSEAQLQEAAALLEAAKAELTRSELDIEYMVIQAPFDGALQERHVEVGDFVKRGDPIASFVDDRTLIVSANISEYDAHYIAKGQEGSAILATGESVTGVVRYMAPVADEATRTFAVELAIDNASGAYRAGMTAKLMIPGETVSAQRVSPSLLTLDDGGNLGVKTLNEAGMVEFHRADIVMSSSDGIWIAGLPHSTTLITVGQGFVNEGALVDAIPEDDIATAVAIKSATQVH
jgi:multidrug efflux system membrane fusion protein